MMHTMTGMQLQLFKDIGYPPRPRIYDDQVLEATMEKVLPKVLKWREKNGTDYTDSDDVKTELKDAIEFEDDSRKILNYLEDHYYWSVNRDLQEIMDEVAEERYIALTQLTNQWVLQNGVSPKHSVGQRVSFVTKNKTHEGVVAKVDESVAKYLVRCKQLGHVETGIGTHGTLLPFEDVRAIGTTN